MVNARVVGLEIALLANTLIVSSSQKITDSEELKMCIIN